ncbi:MAG: 4-(cytidine 5'-diphospho)-2-C-methyl-D-erythritol kinase [Planctomycetota bacterium]
MSEQFTKIGDGLLVRAPGKVNLSLLVKGKRPDGYHDIESIMAKIDWYDEILIEENSEFRIQNAEENVQYPMSNVECPSEPKIQLICKGEYKVPEGEENLVYKAAKVILDTERKKNVQYPMSNVECQSEKDNERQNYDSTGWKPMPRVKITLTKNMPAGSGLGSGSSDAAATLMGINKFLKLGLGKKEIKELAVTLGSDVAFFLDGPLGLCTGRGEKVKKLEGCEFRVLLIIPDVSVSTKRVYENYRHDEAKYRRLSEEINVYIEKKRIDLICGMCANILEESCFELHPKLGVLKKRIESLGIRPVCLSGSGSSMYCIINNRNEETVMANRDKLKQEFGCRSFIVNNNMW